MVKIKSVNEIILNMLDHFRLTIPDADTKPGTVIRDIAIDAPANQLALLYDEISNVSNLQSLRLVSGSDLDNLAKNYGVVRKQSTTSTGVAILTFSSIVATISVNKGDLVYASNGISFEVSNGLSVNPGQLNYYASIATKYRNDLDFVGIKDQYAVEVTVQASTSGLAGNISKYSLNRTNISGVTGVTNVADFVGGSNQETDAVFRDRVLALFSGSSVGTALGYKSTALATTGVIDSYIVQPNDPLMQRDGTVTTTDSNGNITIVSEGTGGKVDVVVYGQNLSQNVDTFIYQDKSNSNDATNSKNDIVLGQIAADAGKTINRKRVDDIQNGQLPAQPVQNITQVSGSSSGANFLPKSIDSLGRVSGNYELIKDTGVYAGSPWGFDKFHWISNKISGFQEDRVKNQFNGQDNLSFSDVMAIPAVTQNISLTNENSIVSSADRSIIQLLHTPSTNVTRVFNVNTGERYLITNQNLDNTGATNTTGRIQISGNTLPSPSDVLQVDYTWVVSYDPYIDYDGKSGTHNLRPLTDSVDWGYSNLIRDEKILFTKDITGNFFIGTAIHPISSVIYANFYNEATGVVYQVSSGIYAGRLAVNITNLSVNTVSVDNVLLTNTYVEVYNTAENDGVFINSTMVVGPYLKYVTTIILPTDTFAVVGNNVTITLNSQDTYNLLNANGSINVNQLTIPASNISTTATSIYLYVSYIAAVQDIISTGITTAPLSRAGNGFSPTNNAGFTNYNPANTLRKENQTIQQNLSSQFYIELNLSSSDVNLIPSQVYSVIRLSDFKELWNPDNIGSITINNTTTNYQLIFNGFNSPQVSEKVLVLYYANDIRRFQPFTYSNSIIAKNFDTIQYNIIDNNYSVQLRNLTNETNINYQILEPNSSNILALGSDGYIVVGPNASVAQFASVTESFFNIKDLLYKKLKIQNSIYPNNNGIYEITAYNPTTKQLTITNVLNNISSKQISIIRLADGQDLWTDAGVIDYANNQLKFPATSLANPLDPVIVLYYTYNNLKQSPTRLSVNINDQIVNTGVLSFSGNTLTKVKDVVFTATASGLKQNILAAIKSALSLASSSSIPSNVKLVRVAKLENVNTYSVTSNEVLTINSVYDVQGSAIKDSSYFLEDMIENKSLESFDFILPSTANNLANLPKIGDRLRITFYYLTTNDLENLSFTRNGTLYTNKYFTSINKIFISSGFNASKSAKISASFFNQPISGSRYKATYDYVAPKQNERIVINYNYNKLIADTTFNIEQYRPINADVLVRSAREILVDITMNVVISSTYLTSSTLVLQNLKDALTTAINSNTLGGILDQSDLINASYSVAGIDRVRVIYFNISGNNGQVLSITAQNDQYFSANNVFVNQEYR